MAQIVLERDIGWPFGAILRLHGWMRMTGTTNDFVLRALGVFWGLLTGVILIRAGRVLRIPHAGVLAALAFGTSSYALFFVLDLHGYGLLLLLESAFICLYLRWLKMPSVGRSVPLMMGIIAMVYSHFITELVIAGATLHLLMAQPRRLGRWAVHPHRDGG